MAWKGLACLTRGLSYFRSHCFLVAQPSGAGSGTLSVPSWAGESLAHARKDNPHVGCEYRHMREEGTHTSKGVRT